MSSTNSPAVTANSPLSKHSASSVSYSEPSLTPNSNPDAVFLQGFLVEGGAEEVDVVVIVLGSLLVVVDVLFDVVDLFDLLGPQHTCIICSA